MTATGCHYEMATAAKMLGVGRNQLVRCLKEHKVLCADNSPTKFARDQGYLTESISSYKLPGYNIDRYYRKPIVTDKGLEFVRNIVQSAGLVNH